MDEAKKQEIIKRLQTETINVLSYSYGKDSGACIGACQELGIPIHAIVTADVWATDTIPAELPPMVEWRQKADRIIKEMTGIEVKHVCAMVKEHRRTYENTFYHAVSEKTVEKQKKQRERGRKCHQDNDNPIYGFPYTLGAWCNSRLKVGALEEAHKMIYEKMFYTEIQSGKNKGRIYGFPFPNTPTCNGVLKMGALKEIDRQTDRLSLLSELLLMNPKGWNAWTTSKRFLRLNL